MIRSPAKSSSNPAARALIAEFVGTAMLLATVVGSGIMGERLADGNAALALLANSLATGCGLVALILALGSVSGAHFNPLVTLWASREGKLPWRLVAGYVSAQCAGAFLGVAAANLMFALPAFAASTHVRQGAAQWLSEAIATFGLILVIAACARRRPSAAPFAVAAYITAAYWFTASTSFANPAVTLARMATDTFSGIRPSDAPAFIGAQAAGAVAAALLSRWLFPHDKDSHV
jgi:glycerol uptake facilitator-like aquaporin